MSATMIPLSTDRVTRSHGISMRRSNTLFWRSSGSEPSRPAKDGKHTLVKQTSASIGDAAGTHQLHIVDHFVFVTFECINGVPVEGEGHSLQSLVLGVHADVRLHLNTPQTSVWISFRST